jgi:hypothetical protein
MRKLITFAVNLMETENTNSFFVPSKNSILDPTQNNFLNPDKETMLNPMINKKLNPKENPLHWRESQFEVFKETPLWEYLSKPQRISCLKYLKTLKG